MVLAIDVGNTQTVFGLWDGSSWVASWRRSTSVEDTEDQIAAWLKSLFDLRSIPFQVDRVVCGSVVPGINQAIAYLAEKWFKTKAVFLTTGAQVGLQVDYAPANAVGADRIANALGALAKVKPPVIVVDFGTATTFDTVDHRGVYVGGAILPGILLSAHALSSHTAKLPQIEISVPERAIGRNTIESLQSGVVLGYVDAIDGLATRLSAELEGEVTILSTGGLGKAFAPICRTIQRDEPMLTLEGLLIALERIA